MSGTGPGRRRVLQGLAALGPAALLAPGAARAAPDQTFAYGPHPLQRFDLYRAPKPGAGAFVWVPGGSWATTDRRWVNALPEFVRREGMALVSVGHRLAPDATASQQAQDVATAVARVIQQAGRLGLRPDRVFLGGHSSGGHLAALTAADPALLRAHGLEPKDLAGVVLLDPAGLDLSMTADLASGRPGSHQMVARLFGPDPKAVSPVHLLRPGGPALPPFLVFYVENRPYAVRQSIAFVQAVRAAGGACQLQAVRGEDHVSVAVNFGAQRDRQGRRAAAFFKRYAATG